MAGRRLLLQRLQHDPGDRFGNSVHRRGRSGHLLLPQQMQRQLRVERRPAGQQVVEDGGQRVQVGGRSEPAALDLFGRHVDGRPDDLARGGRRPLEHLRDAEVADLRRPVRGEQDVVRLDVTVQHALAVGVAERRGHRQADRAGLFGSQRAAPPGQRSPGQQLHHHQAQIVGLDIVVDPDHMGMIEPAQHPRLGGEVDPLALGCLGRHHLDRCRPAHLPVLRLQYQPERSRPQLIAEDVVGDGRGDPRPVDDHEAPRRPGPAGGRPVITTRIITASPRGSQPFRPARNPNRC